MNFSLYHRQASMFLVSAGTLAFEVILTRLFALTFWHHFASLLIALALTGFGTAGSVLAISLPGFKTRSQAALFLTALTAGVAMFWGYPAAVRVGLEPLALAWALRPWFDLGLVCLVLVVPFFLAATHIGLILALSDKVSRDYAVNLSGSGAGCLIAAVALAWLPPHQALYAPFFMVMAAAFGQVVLFKRKAATAGLLFIGAILIAALFFPPVQHVEPFKDRSAALAARGGRLEVQEAGSLGLVEVIGGPAFHFLPGLSLSCPVPDYPQKGLFVDGDLIGPITGVSRAKERPAFLDCLLINMPYRTLSPESVLIIEPGGGLNLLAARDSGAKDVSVIIQNRRLVRLMTGGDMAEFTGEIFRRPGVSVIKADPGSYLSKVKRGFDLMVMGDGTRWESGSESGMGVSPLLTAQGLALMLERLNPGGVMGLAGPLMTPPRASIRLMATAEQALRALNRGARAGLILVRDWNTALLMVKPDGFEAGEVEKVIHAAEVHGFDLDYLAGQDLAGLKTFHHLAGSPLKSAAELIMSGSSGTFFSDSFFNLTPATRDRPYFFNFFRLKTLRLILASKEARLLSVTEWGLLFTWGGLLVILILAGAGIFPPLIRLRPKPEGLAFFSLIGLGYMLAEITLLSETIYRLGHPALAVPLVIGTFLVVSGLGSWRWGTRNPVFFTLASAAVLPLALLGLRHAPGGMAAAGLALVPAALMMGVPFAGGLHHLTGGRAEARAWAFGVNGFFSVAGSLTATLVCLEIGHLAAIMSASGCYLLAGLSVRRSKTS